MLPGLLISMLFVRLGAYKVASKWYIAQDQSRPLSPYTAAGIRTRVMNIDFWTQKCGRGWENPGFYLPAFPCYDVNHYLQKLLMCPWHPLIFSPPPREMLNTILWLLLFIVSAFNHISVRHFSTAYYLSTIHERQRRCTLEGQK